MAGSDQEGADQSTLDEGTSSTSDGQQLESAREDAAGDSSQNQESAEEGAQRSIRDMLDDEGDASVFVNRDLVEPDTIIDEERIVGRDDQLESVVSFLKPTLQGNRPPNMLLYGPAGTGKSLIIGAVTQQIIELCQSKGERFGVVDINCQPINTLDQAVYELVQTVV
jgi:ORC complex protein Cdc6/Orc1